MQKNAQKGAQKVASIQGGWVQGCITFSSHLGFASFLFKNDDGT